AVLEFMRRSATATDYETLAGLLHDAMQTWGLDGIVEVRGRSGKCDRLSGDLASPLQASILDNLRPVFECLTPSDQDWTRAPIGGLPDIGLVSLGSLDVERSESN
ncbi:MAG: hypothetical protein JNL44_16060, partial [Gemmatimonadetes bacterium]|nr:hypothetical protein [Gemmatimonadota bacterium]